MIYILMNLPEYNGGSEKRIFLFLKAYYREKKKLYYQIKSKNNQEV